MPEDRKELESIEEEMSASISAVVANGALKSKRKFKFAAKDPILASFFQLRKLAGSRKAVLVIDNLETIISNDTFMEELGNIIILCDDSRYSTYNIKLLLVGVPSCILEYFARLKNLSTVSNRVNELHEVSCFTFSQVSALVENGFNHLLKLKIPKNILDEWKTHIYEITLGNPQRVHEYCEVLAYALEDNSGIPAADLTIKADGNWIRKGLRESYSVVASLMNERETEKGRKNQVLYTLGKITTHCFSSKMLSEKLRKEFPESTIGITLNINKILSDLAVRTPSIIKKSSNGSNFEFTDPRYLMVLRTILKKHRGGTVHKLAFKI